MLICNFYHELNEASISNFKMLGLKKKTKEIVDNFQIFQMQGTELSKIMSYTEAASLPT